VTVQISPVDPTSDRDLKDTAAMMTAYWREVLGDDEPATSAAEILESLHVGRADIDGPAFVCRDGDRPVGMSHMDIYIGHGNEHLAFLEDLYVLPSHRRAGVGRRLLDENLTIARAAGRTIVMFGYDDGNVDGAAFAKALGMRLTQSDKQNRVRVADLDRTMLESWNQPVEGYSLVRFDGRTPDDLIDAVVVMQDVMNDAPRSESMGGFLHTVEHRRAAELEMEKAGIEYWYTGVRHDASGAIAGYSDMNIRPGKPWLISQEDTAVHPDHRGKAIGRWVKAVNALRVLDEKPEALFIETWNDGSNKWMLAINTDMGFRPVATWIEAELDL
jgi:GNAT superfamily N-acetyltransferase